MEKNPTKNKAPLMVSVSGIRGISGTSLTPPVLLSYISSFGSYVQQKSKTMNPKIVVGRDSRLSGPWIIDFCVSTLVAMGFSVINVGIVPTPTIQFLTTEWDCNAGIVITASHNPIQWNGLKFVDSDGLFLSPEGCQVVYNNKSEIVYDTEFKGKVLEAPSDPLEAHVNSLLKLSYIDSRVTAEIGFKVALDTTNGAGGPIMKLLLTKLGCTVVPLFLEPTGKFGRSPEPIPSHLKKLCETVVSEKCDLGIATDPDVDRCVFVDNNGVPLGEEYTLGIALDFFLAKKQGNVVVNLSTSRLVDDIAKKYSSKVIRTKVGEINVAVGMLKHSAVIGGEGNGGVMLPDSHIGRDAPVSATLALMHFTNLKKINPGLTFSGLKASLPQYSISKMKVNIASLSVGPDKIIESYREKFSHDEAVQCNTLDGIRIDHPDYWVHLRKSNTEPIIRVIGEASCKGQDQDPQALSDALCQRFMNEITEKFQ